MSNGAKATDLRCTETNLRKNRAFYENRGTRTDASQDAASMHAPTARTASGAAASAAPSVRPSASGTAHEHSHTHADFASHGELPGGLSLQVQAQTRGTGSFAIYVLPSTRTRTRTHSHALARTHKLRCARTLARTRMHSHALACTRTRTHSHARAHSHALARTRTRALAKCTNSLSRAKSYVRLRVPARRVCSRIPSSSNCREPQGRKVASLPYRVAICLPFCM